jgi:hypothetical protein
MKKTVLIAVAASAVALAGCATPTTQASPRQCETMKDTNVTVIDSKYIFVSQEPIIVCKKNQWLYWQLDGNQKYRFTQNGVVIRDTDNEFTDCKPGNSGNWQQNGLRFACHDKNDKNSLGLPPRYYKYSINLEIPGQPGSAISIDPTIMND